MALDLPTIYAFAGFVLAAYSVIGNDAVQTLGTFMASNLKIFRWYWLWLAASTILCVTLFYGWYVHGDISYGRLANFEVVPIQWYHAMAPLVLVILTRFGVPVSTTFMVLSVFASSFVMEKMLVKSALGYGVAAIVAYAIWMVVARIINEKYDKVKKKRRKIWRTLQWGSTGFLWATWLMHDMANIAIFLPRELSLEMLLVVMFVLVAALGNVFRKHGGKINHIVLEKSGARFMRSATIVDLVFALLLLVFKEINNIPMSTTWVFVGLLAGRELAIATTYRAKYKMRYIYPLLVRDFVKMMVGLVVSVTVVMLVHSVFKGGISF